MVKKKGIALLFIFFLIIGLIHGLLSCSLNIFFSWIFIGIWIIITFKIIQNIKRHREFNSPHNTAFFVVIPLFMGIFYSIWGYFTGILGENLIEGSNFYFSFWSLIFGFPYITYGSYSLYRCFKKYNVIYFGTRSINAKTFGFILTIIVILFIIAYWITFYSILVYFDSILIPLHFSFSLNLLLLFISSILIMIAFGFSSSQSTIPELTNEYIEQRTRRMNSLVNPRTSTIPRTQRQRTRNRNVTQSPSNISQTSRSTTSISSSRTNPRSRTETRSTKVTHSTKTTSSKSIIPQNRRKKMQNFDLYKPKAAFLSQDDFKCIFCFKLPKLPEDKGRGIILCPNCRYPAHADEFKDWLRTSNLCSRCSSPIPSNYRNNPKIINIKNYMAIYRHFLNKKDKR